MYKRQIHTFGSGPYGYYLRVGLLLALVLVGLLALWTRMLRREVQALSLIHI